LTDLNVIAHVIRL